MNPHQLSFVVSALASDWAIEPTINLRFDREDCPSRIWQQKVFCILSSQFSAEKSAYIAEHLVNAIPFFELGPTAREVEVECQRVLTEPGFRHRFPNLRAKQIAFCWFAFSQVADEYQEYVSSFSSEDQARSSIVRTFPGMGLKQASMFLRNIGAAKTLAVVDVHILAYLAASHGWERRQLNRRDYLIAEGLMQHDAAALGLELNVFDAMVWAAVRATKGARYV